MKILKPIAKTFGYILGVLTAISIIHTLIVSFPQPFFRHRLTYKNFTVYCTEEMPKEIYTVLDRTHALLSASKINDNGLHHKIFLCNSYRLIRFFLIRNVHFGANVLGGNTFIADADIVNDIARCMKISADDNRLRTLSGSIAHEITHRLIRDHFGIIKERQISNWIKEGYCDFIANDSAIDLHVGASILKRGEPIWIPGYWNFKHRTMVAYLMNVRKMAFEDIARQSPKYGEIESKVLSLLHENEESFLTSLKPE